MNTGIFELHIDLQSVDKVQFKYQLIYQLFSSLYIPDSAYIKAYRLLSNDYGKSWIYCDLLVGEYMIESTDILLIQKEINPVFIVKYNRLIGDNYNSEIVFNDKCKYSTTKLYEIVDVLPDIEFTIKSILNNC